MHNISLMSLLISSLLFDSFAVSSEIVSFLIDLSIVGEIGASVLETSVVKGAAVS